MGPNFFQIHFIFVQAGCRNKASGKENPKEFLFLASATQKHVFKDIHNLSIGSVVPLRKQDNWSTMYLLYKGNYLVYTRKNAGHCGASLHE